METAFQKSINRMARASLGVLLDANRIPIGRGGVNASLRETGPETDCLRLETGLSPGRPPSRSDPPTDGIRTKALNVPGPENRHYHREEQVRPGPDLPRGGTSSPVVKGKAKRKKREELKERRKGQGDSIGALIQCGQMDPG